MAVKVIPVSAPHQISGLPPPHTVATFPSLGKCCQYATGRSIIGQLHHGDEYGCVAVETEFSYHTICL